MMWIFFHLMVVASCISSPVRAAEKAAIPKLVPVPVFSPAKQPVVTGEFTVGCVIITFKETEIPGAISQAITTLETISGTSQDALRFANKSYRGPKPHFTSATTTSQPAPNHRPRKSPTPSSDSTKTATPTRTGPACPTCSTASQALDRVFLRVQVKQN